MKKIFMITAIAFSVTALAETPNQTLEKQISALQEKYARDSVSMTVQESCDNLRTSFDPGMCSEASFIYADRKLNEAWRQIGQANPSLQLSLKPSQRKFLVDRNQAGLNAFRDGFGEMAQVTQKRVDELVRIALQNGIVINLSGVI